MKKSLLTLLIAISATTVVAQTKDVANALKAYESAFKESENSKKLNLPITWFNLANAYLGVYDAPIKSLWLDASQLELKLVLKDQRIDSTSTRVVNGETYSVDSYYDKDLYYRQNGTLAAWKQTKKYLEGDMLVNSLDALDKAILLDVKSLKAKDYVLLLNQIEARYKNEGMIYYALGDLENASLSFEASLRASSNPLVNKVDTTMIYYIALTANMYKDFPRAKRYFERCIEIGYEMKGDIYSYLAEIAKNEGNVQKSKELLSKAFQKYPTSQSVLVSLINIYIESNDDPTKVLDYIHQAQLNEPSNSSLYYAEGNVWKKLNNIEKAIESYNKASVQDPTYFYGFFAVGATYYDLAVDIQAKAANEVDDAKYMNLVKELEKNLELAIEPFEKCLKITSDSEIRSVVAEYLKNIFFRFREKNEDYKAKYEFYNNLVTNKK